MKGTTMKTFNTQLWNEYYLSKKELIDTIVNSISYFTVSNENFIITDTFDPINNLKDLIIFLYLRLNISKYTIYTPKNINSGKVGFIHLSNNDKIQRYFPYVES